jgi:hypothetical protein
MIVQYNHHKKQLYTMELYTMIIKIIQYFIYLPLFVIYYIKFVIPFQVY